MREFSVPDHEQARRAAADAAEAGEAARRHGEELVSAVEQAEPAEHEGAANTVARDIDEIVQEAKAAADHAAIAAGRAAQAALELRRPRRTHD